MVVVGWGVGVGSRVSFCLFVLFGPLNILYTSFMFRRLILRTVSLIKVFQRCVFHTFDTSLQLREWEGTLLDKKKTKNFNSLLKVCRFEWEKSQHYQLK